MIQAVNGAMTLSVAFDPIGLAMVVASVLVNLAVGFAGIIIPRYFYNYAATWDFRLEESERAEQELRKMMGGA